MLIFSKKNARISKCFYDHHESVALCFEHFERFFKTLFSDNADPNLLESIKVAIDHCESAADEELREAVSVTSESFLPVTRKNLITLVQSTDEIANLCQEVARQIILEKIVLPQPLHRDILDIISITKGQLEMLYVAMDKLLNDFKDIFKDRKILSDIRNEESRVDHIEALLHKRIFELDLTLCEKIYYKDLLETICDISDTIEDIADQIHVMLVEREA